MQRKTEIERNTKETQIKLSLSFSPEAGGKFKGTSGIGFFDHMLNSFAVHGCFDIDLQMTGDLHVDGHHTVEDVGIVLGKALSDIAADKSNINRFGSAFVPMDETLGFAALDFSGRPFLVFDCAFTGRRTGQFDFQLVEEFFRALATNSFSTLHLKVHYGKNDHHKAEALFKAAARAYCEALTLNNKCILSTKGSL